MQQVRVENECLLYFRKTDIIKKCFNTKNWLVMSVLIKYGYSDDKKLWNGVVAFYLYRIDIFYLEGFDIFDSITKLSNQNLQRKIMDI